MEKRLDSVLIIKNPTARGVDFDHALTELENGKSYYLDCNPFALISSTASRTPAKQRKSKVSGLVDTICSHAYENGLSPDALNTITDIITLANHLDQTSITAIIKSLYPTRKVSNDVVVRVVCSLGQGKGKPSAPTQALLVKWLIMVYEALVDSSVLSCLYGVLFNMLDMISLRSAISLTQSRLPAYVQVQLQCSIVSSAVSHHSPKAREAIQDTDAVSAAYPSNSHN